MTTITTGPDGEALFDGMTANELANSLDQRATPVSIPHFTAERMRTAAAALRHLSAQPDPLTITGRLRWEPWPKVGAVRAMLGKLMVGVVYPSLVTGKWGWSRGHIGMIGDTDTEAAARAALVEAVKEAIR